jgi:hypothetical protein
MPFIAFFLKKNAPGVTIEAPHKLENCSKG